MWITLTPTLTLTLTLTLTDGADRNNMEGKKLRERVGAANTPLRAEVRVRVRVRVRVGVRVRVRRRVSYLCPA